MILVLLKCPYYVEASNLYLCLKRLKIHLLCQNISSSLKITTPCTQWHSSAGHMTLSAYYYANGSLFFWAVLHIVELSDRADRTAPRFRWIHLHHQWFILHLKWIRVMCSSQIHHYICLCQSRCECTLFLIVFSFNSLQVWLKYCLYEHITEVKSLLSH